MTWETVRDLIRDERNAFSLAATLPTHVAAATVVALYALDGRPTHVAIRDSLLPEWWESKLGSSWRILHRLDELECPGYGQVVGFYVRVRA